MKAIFTETTVVLIDDSDEKIFIKRRKLINNPPIFIAKFGEDGKYETYTHKLRNGLTIEQQFNEGIRRVK